MRHLLTAAALTADDANSILDTAANLKQTLSGRQIRKLPTLRGRTIVTLFYENSTRTRVSFEIAGKWMSADVINVSAGGSSVGKGESLRDTALTLAAAGADCLIIRHPVSGAAHQTAAWLSDKSISVVNAGDGMHEHPTQALLDAATLRERLGNLSGRRIGIVGDILHSRVARSNIQLLTTLGTHVTVIAPPTLMPTGIEHWLDSRNSSGATLTVTHDLDRALAELDAVMVLRIQTERMRSTQTAGSDAGNAQFFPSLREYSIAYGLNEKRLSRLPAHAVVLHPGPMLRGVEIASSVADAPQAVITDQVNNGVHIRMAVLYRLLAHEEQNQ